MSIPTEADQTPTPLFNPLSSDFTWEYKDKNNQPNSVTLPFGKITYLSKWMADVVKYQLADAVYNERGYGKTPLDDKEKIVKEEIEVKL